jgi:chromosome segregation ATPase
MLAARQRESNAQISTVRCELQTAQAQLAEMHSLHDQLAKELTHKVELLSRGESELIDLRMQRAAQATSTQELEMRCDVVRCCLRFFCEMRKGRGLLVSLYAHV